MRLQREIDEILNDLRELKVPESALEPIINWTDNQSYPSQSRCRVINSDNKRCTCTKGHSGCHSDKDNITWND